MAEGRSNQSEFNSGRLYEPPNRSLSDSDRVFLELHVGSLPDQIREESDLIRFLGDALQQRNLTLGPGNPVVSARINHAGHFAFVMFRSKDEATKALELAGTPCYGNSLRVDRPKGFSKQGTGQSHVDEAQMVATALAASPPVPILPGVSREELKRRLEESINKYGTPTSVVQLSNLTKATTEDVEQEAKKFGMVVAVRAKADEPGSFLVKMSNINEAEKLVQIKRIFATSVVKAQFRPLAEWNNAS